MPDYYSPENMGLIVPKTKDGRVIFLLPWLGYTVAGTTDNPTELTFLPRPTEAEVDFILEVTLSFVLKKKKKSVIIDSLFYKTKRLFQNI